MDNNNNGNAGCRKCCGERRNDCRGGNESIVAPRAQGTCDGRKICLNNGMRDGADCRNDNFNVRGTENNNNAHRHNKCSCMDNTVGSSNNNNFGGSVFDSVLSNNFNNRNNNDDFRDDNRNNNRGRENNDSRDRRRNRRRRRNFSRIRLGRGRWN